MSRLLLALASVSLVCAAGCRRATSCEELVAEPIEGQYRGGAELGSMRLLGVKLQASKSEVVLSFRVQDGSEVHAKYRVLTKRRHR